MGVVLIDVVPHISIHQEVTLSIREPVTAGSLFSITVNNYNDVTVTLPVAARELAAGLAIAWVRVIGEFGIVMVFCYFPQGIPVKLFINLQNDGVASIYPLLWILVGDHVAIATLVPDAGRKTQKAPVTRSCLIMNDEGIDSIARRKISSRRGDRSPCR